MPNIKATLLRVISQSAIFGGDNTSSVRLDLNFFGNASNPVVFYYRFPLFVKLLVESKVWKRCLWWAIGTLTCEYPLSDSLVILASTSALEVGDTEGSKTISENSSFPCYSSTHARRCTVSNTRFVVSTRQDDGLAGGVESCHVFGGNTAKHRVVG